MRAGSGACGADLPTEPAPREAFANGGVGFARSACRRVARPSGTTTRPGCLAPGGREPHGAALCGRRNGSGLSRRGALPVRLLVEARDAIKPKIAAHGRRVTGSKKLGSVTRRPVSFHLKTSRTRWRAATMTRAFKGKDDAAHGRSPLRPASARPTCAPCCDRGQRPQPARYAPHNGDARLPAILPLTKLPARQSLPRQQIPCMRDNRELLLNEVLPQVISYVRNAGG